MLAFGDIDLNFSGDGVHEISYPIATNEPESIEQSIEVASGRIFVGVANIGSGRALTVFKTDGNGQRDMTFGSGGQLRLIDTVEPLAGVMDIAQIDNDTIVVLLSNAPTGRGTLVAFNSNGHIENDFGDQGWLRLPYAYGRPLSEIQADSQGGFLLLNDLNPGFDQEIVRYNSTGQIDNSFGTQGRITFPRIGYPEMRVSSTGAITVVGLRYGGPAGDSPKLIVAHWLPDGQTDASFGDNGVNLSASPVVYNQPTFAPDGEGIYTYEIVSRGSTSDTFRVTKFDPRALPDIGFGNQGVAEFSLPASGPGVLYRLQVDANQRVYFHVGSVSNPVPILTTTSARLTALGELDPTFGDQGVSRLAYPQFKDGFLSSVQIDGDGLLWHGMFDNLASAPKQRDAFSTRVNGHGNVDTSWAAAGTLVVDLTTASHTVDLLQLEQRNDGLMQVFSGWPAVVNGAPTPGRVEALDEDGNIVRSGTLTRKAYANVFATSADGGWYTTTLRYDQVQNLVIAKYFDDGTPDTNFGTQGMLRIATSPMRSVVMRTLSDGSVLVVAEASADHAEASSPEVGLMVRITADGQLDSTFGDNGIIKIFDKPGQVVNVLDSEQLGTAIIYYDVYQQRVTIQIIDRFGRTVTSYGQKGLATIANVSAYRDAAVDEEGRILILSNPYFIDPYLVLELTQIDSRGQVSAGFGNNGTVLLSRTSNAVFGTAKLAVRQGVIAVAATAGYEDAKIRIYGLDYAGRPLTELNADGIREYDLASHGEQVRDLALADDGTLWLAYAERSELNTTGKIIRLDGSHAVPTTNWSHTADVSGDAHVTALDALLVINLLNGGSASSGIFPDVNSDTRVTALDALLIINRLNTLASGEGEAASELFQSSDMSFSYDADLFSRKGKRLWLT